LLIERKDEIIRLNGHVLTVRVIKDIEAIITDPDDEDKVPLWADIWPAARGMAQYIWEYVNFTDKQVLELGAGVGLSGVVAALKGAKLTVTDYNEQALNLTQENLILNGIKDAESFLGDWRSFALEKQFDWIIGSDVLYDPKLNSHILDIIKKNLLPEGKLLFSHPGRLPTYEFIDYIVNEDFQENRMQIPVEIDDPFFPYYNISVHLLSR
jgi:predicted nicotinamide N-methyase